MQAKKAQQLLKARLGRERQIYEMRKRAELKAAVSELERPWEVVERAPTLFSVKTDELVKVLVDRFQKPGRFHMWTEGDGPQLFETPDGLPPARFFPKGVVHSIKPYGKVSRLRDSDDENVDSASGSGSKSENVTVNAVGREMARDGHKRNSMLGNGELRRGGSHTERKNNGVDLLAMEDNSDAESGYAKNSSGKWCIDTKTRGRNGCKFRNQGNTNRIRSDLASLDSEQIGLGRKQRGDGALMQAGDTKTNRSKIDSRRGRGEGNGSRNSRYSKSEVFYMSFRQDRSYGLQAKKKGSLGLLPEILKDLRHSSFKCYQLCVQKLDCWIGEFLPIGT